jgi:hypothetical protein
MGAAFADAAPHQHHAEAATQPRSAAAVIDPRVGDAAAGKARLALLNAAEAALAQGETAAAIAAFDRAALMLHAADTEMGLVRAYLQQGDYRRALAFAAHTAGAHRDTPSAAALYAWLLAAGGQGAFAQRVLNEASLRAPLDPMLADVRQKLAAPAAATTAASLDTPHRMAPHALMLSGNPALPPAARVVASGVLLDDGRHAVVPLAAPADERSPLWVRDGLGRTTPVRVVRRIDALGLALAELTVPLPGAHPAPAPRAPFAGSPGYVVGFAAAGDATPAWPWLHLGFVGAAGAAPVSARRLGIDVPASLQGAPLFDAAGRWAGITVKDADGRHVLLSIERLRDELGDLLAAPAASGAAPAPRIAPDEVYERSLRVVLQVIAAAPAP